MNSRCESAVYTRMCVILASIYPRFTARFGNYKEEGIEVQCGCLFFQWEFTW